MCCYYTIFMICTIILWCFSTSINAKITEIEKTELIHGSNNFATNLYSKLLTSNEQQNEKSFVFSPFSIQSSFGMLYCGTRGIVAEELEKTFNFGTYGRYIVSENFKDTYDTYKKSTVMKLANKIVIDNNAQIRPEYQDIIKDNYDSDVQLLDFKKSNESAGIINYWVNNKTGGKINKIIDANKLDPNTRLILISAIYIKSKWMHSFNKNETLKKDFWLTNTKSIKIDMMHVTNHFKYRRMPSLKSVIIELPYMNSNLSMVLFVPKQRDGLKLLESKINELDLVEWSKDMREAEINLYMPKFNIETEIDLTQPLQKMGLQEIFNGGDFSDLAKYDDNILLSKATHKAIIEVNEEGTEASAVTKNEISARTGPIIVNADHPFLFMIKDKSGHSFFMGRVNG